MGLPSTQTHPPSYVLRQYLIDAGIGVEDVDADWNVYANNLPDEGTQDKAMSVSDTLERMQGRLMAGPTMNYPGVQVRVRALTDTDAYVKVKEVALALDALAATDAVTVALDPSPKVYTLVAHRKGLLRMGPSPVGDDNRKRYNWSVNADLIILSEEDPPP